MNTKKYLTFLKIVETGSLSKAAVLMGHTQSGVTQLIHSLETEFGVRLFIRNRSGIQLTDEGKKLYPFIKDVVNSNDRLEDVVKHLHSNEENIIRIGTFTSVAVNWLPNIIEEYQKIAPDTRIEMLDLGYNNPGQELFSGKMDLAFVPIPLSVNCVSIPLCSDRLMAVLPVNHPAAKMSACPVSLFATEPVIGMIDNLDRDARSVFENANIIPNIKYTTENDFAMLAMIEKNLGIGIIPELILKNNTKDVVIMKLDPPATRTIGLAYASYETASPSVLRFAEFIQSWVRDTVGQL